MIENDFSRIELADTIKNRIESICVSKYDDGHRNHLGASIIGDECSRKLFYIFRWCKHIVHTGRLYRLFQRGHREEAYIVDYLKSIGFLVWEYQDDGVTQHRISDCGGHFGGSLDGLCRLPSDLAEKYNFHDTMLLEIKTINQNGHNGLSKNGMIVSKPQHYEQTCTYGKKMGLHYVCYVSVNKNDDTTHIEIVPLDHNVGQSSILKAEFIINSKVLPEKLSQQSTHFKCKMCDFKGICHHGQPLDRNCRSCGEAEPIDNSEWYCNSRKCVIPKEYIAGEQSCWVGVQ